MRSYAWALQYMDHELGYSLNRTGEGGILLRVDLDCGGYSTSVKEDLGVAGSNLVYLCVYKWEVLLHDYSSSSRVSMR